MSQVLTVPTHFNDIGELSEGFLDRVERDTLILYGPVAYEDGAEIEFVVLLADGTPALEGKGRVRAAVDGGADRVPETRYDVVLEALTLDGRSEVVFERLVIDRQAVSEPPPPADEEAPVTGEIDSPMADEDEVEAVGENAMIDRNRVERDHVGHMDEADDDDIEMTVEQVESLDPEANDDELDRDIEGEEPVAVLEEVDPQMLEAVAEADSDEPELEVEAGPEVTHEMPTEHEDEIAAVLANANATEITIGDEADGEDTSKSLPNGSYDSMYAFEHGIAAEPKVGMPVPMPSMAAPPMAPPAPPRLRLAEPPDGLTRPSLAEPEEAGVTVDGEVSDVHQTGMFAYEDGLPIPERPPLPDPNRAKQVPTVEAANDFDVQGSDPAELLSEGYEEVRLSDFAEAVEEG